MKKAQGMALLLKRGVNSFVLNTDLFEGEINLQ